METATARQKLDTLTDAQTTDNLLAALVTMEERWTTTGLEKHESLVRHTIVSTITKRHGISGRVNDLYLDEADGFTGTELEAILIALAEQGVAA